MSDEEEYSGGEGEEPEAVDAQDEKVCACISILWSIKLCCVCVCVLCIQAVEDNPLTKELAGECLSLLCKTGNGLAHAYVRMDVKEK